MDKKSIIKELFWNIEEISGSSLPKGPEYDKAIAAKEQAEEKLMKLLPEGGREVFEDFMTTVGDVEILIEEEIYRQGFCFGLTLTAEAYTNNMNRMTGSADD